MYPFYPLWGLVFGPRGGCKSQSWLPEDGIIVGAQKVVFLGLFGGTKGPLFIQLTV